MTFVALVLVITIFLFIYLSKKKDRYAITKAILFMLFISIIVNISLYHNYTQSLFLSQDGISISNFIAYQFFPDHSWSIEFFKQRFDQSIVVSATLLIMLITVYFGDILK